MNKLIIICFVIASVVSGCSMPEDEKKLKEAYDKWEQLAETPEAKERVRMQYKEALEKLRTDKKEKDEKAKIFYTVENDVSDKLYEFLDEVWADPNYNEAKFNIRNKEFKWKSVIISGEIRIISSDNKRNYIMIYYKHDYKYTDFSDRSRSICFTIDFEKPEDIMDFKEKQEITLECVYDDARKSTDFSRGETYFVNFFHPKISIKKKTVNSKEWFQLTKNEMINDFILSSNNTITFKDKEITGLKVSEKADEISISSISSTKKFVFLDNYSDFMEEKDKKLFFLCDLVNNTSFVIDFKAPPLQWCSWSPNDKFALLGSYYEADFALYILNLSTYKTIETKLDKDIKKDTEGYVLEQMTFNEKIEWINENQFNVIVNITCHPYVDDNCTDEKRDNVLRSYLYTVDAPSNTIIKSQKITK